MLLAITEGTQANAEAETMEECYLLVQLSLFYNLGPTCLGVIPPIVPIKKMPHRHAHRLVYWKQLHKWGSLLPGDSSLCQFDLKKKKPASRLTSWCDPDYTKGHHPEGLTGKESHGAHMRNSSQRISTLAQAGYLLRCLMCRVGWGQRLW